MRAPSAPELHVGSADTVVRFSCRYPGLEEPTPVWIVPGVEIFPLESIVAVALGV
jgi:hypothetical protein